MITDDLDTDVHGVLTSPSGALVGRPGYPECIRSPTKHTRSPPYPINENSSSSHDVHEPDAVLSQDGQWRLADSVIDQMKKLTNRLEGDCKLVAPNSRKSKGWRIKPWRGNRSSCDRNLML